MFAIFSSCTLIFSFSEIQVRALSFSFKSFHFSSKVRFPSISSNHLQSFSVADFRAFPFAFQGISTALLPFLSISLPHLPHDDVAPHTGIFLAIDVPHGNVQAIQVT